MSLKLYADLLSQPCRSLYIILKQSGAAFETVPVAIRKGEHLTSEFKKINRFQKLPCITEGDFKLAESVAILRYLASTNRVSESLYGSEVKERARIDEFLEWQHILRKGGVGYFRLAWVAPLLTGKPTPEVQLEKARKELEEVLDSIENTWLASTKFITGNQLTVADIFGVCEVQQTKLTDFDVSKKYPKITEWIENVRKGTNPDFDDAHKFIYKYAAKK